jgi:creatinine amidohydrolase
VAVLPAIPFGVQSAQLDVKLNINMMPSTQLAVLKDIVESLEIQGFRKLLLLNSHGGNTFVSALREIYPRTKVRIFLVNTYAIVDAKRHFEVPGEHAGALQTSALMHIAPELVRPLAEAGNGYARSLKIPSMKEGWVWSQRGWLGEVTEDTGIGNPHGASAAKGRAFLDEVVAKVSTLMLEIAALDSSQPYE